MQVDRSSVAAAHLPLRPRRVAAGRWVHVAAARGSWYALGAVILVVYVIPFAWMILGSLRVETEIFQFTYPLTWRTFIPVAWTLKNF